MERTSLNVDPRESGKAKNAVLRTAGKVPAVLYGRDHTPVNLSVDYKEILRVLSSKAGLNVLIDLNITGSEKVVARVCDYQADPLTRNFVHIDFQIVDLKRKVEVEVPVHFEGKAPGVKEGGVMDIQRRTLHVRCLPTAIPEFIAVDISGLNINDNIHINELKLPEGVDCPHDQNFVIVAVVPPAKEEVVAPVVAAEGDAAAGATPAAGAAGAAGAAAPAAAGDKKAAAPAAGGDKKPAGK